MSPTPNFLPLRLDALHPPLAQRWRWLIWALGSVLMLWFFILALRHHPTLGGTFGDFYRAAEALRKGEPLQEVEGYIYPPLMAWLLQPLSTLPLAQAYRGWQLITFLLTASSLWIGSREVTRRFGFAQDGKTLLTIIFGALLLSAGEAKTEWSVAQCDSLVLDSFVFSLALLEGSPVLCGAVIAFGINIKYQAIILLPYLLWRCQFRAALAAAGFTIVLGWLPALTMGWQATRQCWAAALGGMATLFGIPAAQGVPIHAVSWDHSISLTSSLARGGELAHCSLACSLAVAALLGIAFLLVYARFYRVGKWSIFGALERGQKPPLLALEWATVMVLLLAFGPQTTRRHLFIMLFFHLILAACLLLPKLPPGSRRALVAGTIIYQLGLRLPPSAGWCAAAAEGWKYVGGPAWALLGI